MNGWLSNLDVWLSLQCSWAHWHTVIFLVLLPFVAQRWVCTYLQISVKRLLCISCPLLAFQISRDFASVVFRVRVCSNLYWKRGFRSQPCNAGVFTFHYSQGLVLRPNCPIRWHCSNSAKMWKTCRLQLRIKVVVFFLVLLSTHRWAKRSRRL